MNSAIKYVATCLLTQFLTSTSPVMAEEKAPAAKTRDTPTVVDATREQAALLEYVAALELISRGEEEAGKAALQKVVTNYPGTFTESRARDMLLRLEENPHPSGPERSAQVADSGRAELIASQTLIGAYLGALFPLMMGAENGGAFAGGALMGATAGLAASTFSTADRDVSEAEALALYMGELWGGANAVLVGTATELIDDDRTFAASQFVGMGLGGAASLSLQRNLGLSVGQVNLAYSSTLWSAALSELMLVTALSDRATGERAYLVAPVLVGNCVLAMVGSQVSTIPISRSRVRLVNLGGSLGALVVTAGLSIKGWNNINSAAGVTVPYIAGVATGLAVAWQVTNGWDEEYHPEIFAKGPSNSLLALEEGQVKLGNVVPTVTFEVKQGAEGERSLTPVAQVNLLSGTW